MVQLIWREILVDLMLDELVHLNNRHHKHNIPLICLRKKMKKKINSFIIVIKTMNLLWFSMETRIKALFSSLITMLMLSKVLSSYIRRRIRNDLWRSFGCEWNSMCLGVNRNPIKLIMNACKTSRAFVFIKCSQLCFSNVKNHKEITR